ncbi:hypothetical protein [Rhizobium gallicum]|nr:hypothetical protein [Rhizobium gallicum]
MMTSVVKLAICIRQSSGQNVVSRRNSVSIVMKSDVASSLQAAANSAVVSIMSIHSQGKRSVNLPSPLRSICQYIEGAYAGVAGGLFAGIDTARRTIAVFVGEHGNPASGSDHRRQTNESEDFDAAYGEGLLSARPPARGSAIAEEPDAGGYVMP